MSTILNSAHKNVRDIYLVAAALMAVNTILKQETDTAEQDMDNKERVSLTNFFLIKGMNTCIDVLI